MTVRAKMRITNITSSFMSMLNGDVHPYQNIRFEYTNDGMPSDDGFADNTITSFLSLSIQDAPKTLETFKMGKEYFIDITPIQ